MNKLTQNINLADKSLFPSETVIIKFGTETCPPCRSLHPKLEQLSQENKDITVCYVDVDENLDIMMWAIEEGIISSFMSIPTTFIFKNWQRVWSPIVWDNINEIISRV